MKSALYDEMFHLEEKHWWFAARRRIVLTLLRQKLELDRSEGADAPVVCDVGAGCGLTLAELAKRYSAAGMDIADEAITYSNNRGVKVLRGSLPDDVPFEPGRFDAVLALDVIEHVTEDRAAVEALVRLLKPGGIVMLTVPAHMWLWTKRDEAHGHKRRYRRSQLRRLLDIPGLKLELLTYFNCFLFPLAVLERLARRHVGLDHAGPDLKLPPPALNAIMKAVFASESMLLLHTRLPFGLSLMGIGRRS